MSNTATFKTSKPICLSSQVKSFGTHTGIPISNEDAFKVIASGAELKVVDANGEEHAITFDNIDEVIPPTAGEDGDEEVDPQPEEPGKQLITIDGTHVYLNGVPAVIIEKDGATVVKAADSKGVVQEYQIPANCDIYGGSYKGNVDNTSIVIESGTVSSVFGGGRGTITETANVKNSKIVVNGGNIRNIAGGGFLCSVVEDATVEINGGNFSESIIGGGHASNKVEGSVGTKEHPENSPCIVNKATVIIKDAKMKKNTTIFGGGQGYSYTKEAEVVIDGCEASESWIVAGGSNGRTDTAKMTINNGDINVVQGINRGSMLNAEVVINGGTFKKVFAGGEDPESLEGDIVNGVIGNIKLDVNGGNITELLPGSNGRVTIKPDDEKVAVTVSSAATVANIEDAKTAFGSSIVIE